MHTGVHPGRPAVRRPLEPGSERDGQLDACMLLADSQGEEQSAATSMT